MPVFAIDLDYSVDDTIRKNYNSNVKIVPKKATTKPKVQAQPITKTTTSSIDKMPTLPALPKSVQSKTTVTTKPKTTTTTYKKPASNYKPAVYKQPTTTYSQPQVYTSNITTAKRSMQPIRKGMIFPVNNLSKISDWQRRGTKILFKTPRPIQMVYYTIPQDTILVGFMDSSHGSQLSGNGGLISIKISYIILNGQYQKVNAKVVKLNDKNIFFNDIKGKRTYWKNTVQKGKWGRNAFHKMNRISASLAKDKTTVILSPFTFIYGAALGGISTVTSPVTGLFTKGKDITIPANSSFYVKFIEDSKLYY